MLQCVLLKKHSSIYKTKKEDNFAVVPYADRIYLHCLQGNSVIPVFFLL